PGGEHDGPPVRTETGKWAGDFELRGVGGGVFQTTSGHKCVSCYRHGARDVISFVALPDKIIGADGEVPVPGNSVFGCFGGVSERGRGTVLGVSKNSGGLFPLTPTLSLGERESVRRAFAGAG